MKPQPCTQARWRSSEQLLEPTIFELSQRGKVGFKFSPIEERVKARVGEPSKLVPPSVLRRELALPEVSEVEVVRHYTRLSQMNYGVDSGPYWLGSCTMKYNPKICERIARFEQVQMASPHAPEEWIQGCLKILYELKKLLCEITGLHDFTLQPFAGAGGEYTGCKMIWKYHKLRGEDRDEMLIPDSAHGTNPASAAMCGFKVVKIPSGEDGTVDIEALKATVSRRTAGIMLTVPNTLGIFEHRVKEICEIVHDVGGLVYYDGANLNALVGRVKISELGVDIAHLNLHKTFSTPHGGGGPGAGPVGAVEELAEYLPSPDIVCEKGVYRLKDRGPKSIGRVHPYLGNFPVLLKALVYIKALGLEGLREVSGIAVLNSNYLLKKLKSIECIEVPFDGGRLRAHEFTVSLRKVRRETGVRMAHIAKRILDFGIHPPTVYFPLIVREAMMVEPTESATKQDLDLFYEVMKRIIEECYSSPESVLTAPHNTSVRRVDEAQAARRPVLSWRMYLKGGK